MNRGTPKTLLEAIQVDMPAVKPHAERHLSVLTELNVLDFLRQRFGQAYLEADQIVTEDGVDVGLHVVQALQKLAREIGVVERTRNESENEIPRPARTEARLPDPESAPRAQGSDPSRSKARQDVGKPLAQPTDREGVEKFGMMSPTAALIKLKNSISLMAATALPIETIRAYEWAVMIIDQEMDK